MTPVALALAWGVLLAAPLAGAARRTSTTRRAIALTPPRRTRRLRLRPALLVPRLGPVGRVGLGLARAHRARRETYAIGRDLPVTLDLLAVAVGSGCTPYGAVEVAAGWAPPRTRRVLTDVLHATALGTSFAEALGSTGRATPAVAAVLDAVATSDRLGSPLAPVLERLAAEARADQRRRAEAHARRVPVRLLFPLVFLVLPAFGLLTVVPVLLAGFART